MVAQDPRRGVLVVAGGGGDPIAVDDDGREVGVNGGDGEASAESGGAYPLSAVVHTRARW